MDITISYEEPWVTLDIIDELISLLHSVFTYFSGKPSSRSVAIVGVEGTPRDWLLLL